jgi:hypothetical protein
MYLDIMQVPCWYILAQDLGYPEQCRLRRAAPCREVNVVHTIDCLRVDVRDGQALGPTRYLPSCERFTVGHDVVPSGQRGCPRQAIIGASLALVYADVGPIRSQLKQSTLQRESWLGQLLQPISCYTDVR